MENITKEAVIGNLRQWGYPAFPEITPDPNGGAAINGKEAIDYLLAHWEEFDGRQVVLGADGLLLLPIIAAIAKHYAYHAMQVATECERFSPTAQANAEAGARKHAATSREWAMEKVSFIMGFYMSYPSSIEDAMAYRASLV